MGRREATERFTRTADLRITNCPDVPPEKLQAAIGYLTLWGISLFPKCLIANDEDGNIDATYFRENGDVGYVIGVIWRKQAGGEFGYDFNS